MPSLAFARLPSPSLAPGEECATGCDELAWRSCGTGKAVWRRAFAPAMPLMVIEVISRRYARRIGRRLGRHVERGRQLRLCGVVERWMMEAGGAR